jgi:hypothetical protein
MRPEGEGDVPHRLVLRFGERTVVLGGDDYAGPLLALQQIAVAVQAAGAGELRCVELQRAERVGYLVWDEARVVPGHTGGWSNATWQTVRDWNLEAGLDEFQTRDTVATASELGTLGPCSPAHSSEVSRIDPPPTDNPPALLEPLPPILRKPVRHRSTRWQLLSSVALLFLVWLTLLVAQTPR